MTEALYLSDSYLTTTTSQVVEVGSNYLILDQTVFYPQGGGQPSDKGTIKSNSAELNVKSVEYNGGNIKHVGIIKGEFAITDSVALEIDWPLRLKNMQLHTAGHIVDLLVRQLYPTLVPIRGMHGIGKKLFIEYEGLHELDTSKLNAELTKFLLSKPEIKTQFVTLDELKAMSNWIPERLPTSKKLRVLSIGGTYHIPDGGTQLKSGEPIWPIVISKIETTLTTTLVHYQVIQPKIERSNDLNHDNKTIVSSDISKISGEFSRDLDSIESQKDLDLFYLKYFGKKGITTELLKSLQGLTLQDKKTYGPLLNDLKKSQETQISQKKHDLSLVTSHLSLDLTIPGIVKSIGRLHPTTTIIREMNEFFTRQGFSIGEGPEIEDVEYNFRRLNLPEGHPATDLQDSLFIQEPNLLLRTHTSSVETRMLSDNKPPMRVVVPGKCYRNETQSLTNSGFFYQYQGFVVDKGINMGHLKNMITTWFKYLWGDDIKIRFRYKYYPEVSPGLGQDIQCTFCSGVGCQVCKYRGWIEMGGSGMIHSNTLRACGIDPDIYSGFAFGVGLDRMVMTKYNIRDIRKLYGGEIVYK